MKPDTIGYLIKPLDGTIEKVIMGSDYKSIARWIGCHSIDVVRCDGFDLYVDDEGLLIQRPPGDFVLVTGYPQPLAGNCVVLSCDEEGESITPTVAIEDIVKQVYACMIITVKPDDSMTCMTVPLEIVDAPPRAWTPEGWDKVGTSHD